MESLYIQQKEDTPKILFDSKNGKILIEGESYPENTFEFYEPILKWLKDYFKSTNKKLDVDIKFFYCNFATIQILFDIFDLFEENQDKINIIRWYIEEDNNIIYERYKDFVDEFEDLNICLIKKGERL